MENKCPKCNGMMKVGVVNPAAQSSQNLKWGEFNKSSVMNKIENQIEIKAYKCEQCGYVEMYAK